MVFSLNPQLYQQKSRALTIPSSSGGINAISSFANMPPQDCIYTYNMMPSEYGMRLRKGYREVVKNLGGEVRSLIPFLGSQQDGLKDKLFATTELGLLDASGLNDDAPPTLVSWTNPGPLAGHGVHTQFTSDASEHFLFYADEDQGLFRYDESTELWAQATGIVGVDVASVAFVAAHKQRIWLVERDSGDAWYLPVDAIAGTVTKFTFGSKFSHGGRLVGVWSWTIDGGDGVDDYLVAVSSSGDVLVYQGSDPSQPDWSLVGSYYIGETPDSRRIGINLGSDLYLLSVYGLVSVASMLRGAEEFDFQTSPTAKITRLVRNELLQNKASPVWALHINPEDSLLQILVPKNLSNPYIQFCQNTTTRAWGMWRDVPAISAAEWRGEYYFGNPDGSVFAYRGALDGDLLDGTRGEPIEYSTLTSFQDLGAAALNKMVGMVRAVSISGVAETIAMKVLYDYNTLDRPWHPEPPGEDGASRWDEAIWDVSRWDSPINGTSRLIGAEGIGRVAAVAIRGRATSRVFLVQFELVLQGGGFL